MSENSEEKFIRVAERRVNNAIKTIRLIGNLSNRTNYSYTEHDIELIFSALNKELKACQERFRNSLPKQSNNFTLKK
ncbi:hypothetical protein [Methylophaga thalassica]|uniref:hypothetical protein n=1 Tax=Methylophaga thalassica TaxID=40223 RepID=UPI002E7B9FEE|nr:hypothetical protein [Methylophaga thalassica]WVI85658.1 hypothetical protein VSX76_03350 [Methylophaga thalassica]